jgi:hypothetical protein
MHLWCNAVVFVCIKSLRRATTAPFRILQQNTSHMQSFATAKLPQFCRSMARATLTFRGDSSSIDHGNKRPAASHAIHGNIHRKTVLCLSLRHPCLWMTVRYYRCPTDGMKKKIYYQLSVDMTATAPPSAFASLMIDHDDTAPCSVAPRPHTARRCAQHYWIPFRSSQMGFWRAPLIFHSCGDMSIKDSKQSTFCYI